MRHGGTGYIGWPALALLAAVVGGISGEIHAATDENTVVDGPTDPVLLRLMEIEQANRAAMVASLKASAQPRDWAFAALIEQPSSTVSTSAEREALLGRAAAGAPNDVLVQWIAELQHAPSATDAVGDNAPLHALQRLEPDNAAVWLQALTSAMQRGDRAAIDTALAQMAASRQMDDHFFELQAELTKVCQRYPLPDEYFAVAATQKVDAGQLLQSREAMPYVMANAITMATSMPAYQFPIKACRVNPATGENLQHRDACAATGRLMAAQGKTMLANRIGFAMLRVSGTYTDADVQNARAQDWTWRRWQTISTSTNNADAELQAKQIVALIHDQSQTRSELQAARLAVARAGEAATPPADWIDDYSPFSEERLRGDQVAVSQAN
jgi:hypothetical protein